MGIDFPSRLSASAGQKFTYSGQEYEFNGTAWKKVRDKVTSFNGATGAIVGVTSVQGKTGDVTLTDLEITHGVETFNGLSGSIDTTSLVLPVAGISGPSAITFDNGEVIRNNPDGSIQIIPSDEGGNHFGIEIDATEWGFGPVINVIDESGTQVTKTIRLDTDITFSDTNVPDGSPARLMFGNGADRGFQQNNNNDGTVMFGVNGNNGHFAVGRKADLADSDRSMSTSDKTALGMSNPQFLVYSADQTDADDYIRLEHDQTNGNIFSGNGGINLVPSSGAVGISGGGLNIKANGITFADGTFLSSEGQIAFKNESNTFTQDNTFSTNQIFSNGTGIGTDSSTPSIRFNSNNLVTLGDPEEGSNGVKLTVSDSAQLVTVSDANFKASQSIQVGSSIYHDGDADTILTFGTNTIDIKAGNSSNLSLDTSKTKSGVLFNAAAGISMDTAGITFADGTFQKTATKDVGTFTISASSAISTGAKADALHRIPYNATLTKFEIKSKATGGFTAAVYIAGGDFGDPTTGFSTGATAETTGVTGATTTFGTSSVSEGDFVYLHVLANESGATAAQAFVSYETRA